MVDLVVLVQTAERRPVEATGGGSEVYRSQGAENYMAVMVVATKFNVVVGVSTVVVVLVGGTPAGSHEGNVSPACQMLPGSERRHSAKTRLSCNQHGHSCQDISEAFRVDRRHFDCS